VLWIAKKDTRILAVCVTAIERRLSGLVCQVRAISGSEMARWINTDEIEKYAKAEGCVKVAGIGRDGWERAAPGYHRVGVILEKRI
jgi:hypothetical protein